MFSSIRKRLTYANVMVTFALVFAMSGGAYAASKYLITSTKQISPKVLKSLKGASGKAGAVGPQGAAGPAGAAGPVGPAGKEGPAGKGERGEKGEAGLEGKEGKEGKAGTTGFTATLPKEQTEKGTWAYSLVVEGNVSQLVPISFPIPLSKELEAGQVHYILANGKEWDFATKAEAGSPSTACLGSVAEPKAVKGNLCVYAEAVGAEQEGLQVPAPERIANPSGTLEAAGIIEGAGKSGAIMGFVATKFKIGYGTWAVTAE
jgi:hypothetical protein